MLWFLSTSNTSSIAVTTIYNIDFPPNFLFDKSRTVGKNRFNHQGPNHTNIKLNHEQIQLIALPYIQWQLTLILGTVSSAKEMKRKQKQMKSKSEGDDRYL